jgi:hypothetical protein
MISTEKVSRVRKALGLTNFLVTSHEGFRLCLQCRPVRHFCRNLITCSITGEVYLILIGLFPLIAEQNI